MTLPQSVTVTWTADDFVIESRTSRRRSRHRRRAPSVLQAKRIADLIDMFERQHVQRS